MTRRGLSPSRGKVTVAETTGAPGRGCSVAAHDHGDPALGRQGTANTWSTCLHNDRRYLEQAARD